MFYDDIIDEIMKVNLQLTEKKAIFLTKTPVFNYFVKNNVCALE